MALEMALELSSEWIPGSIYQVVYMTGCAAGSKPQVPPEIFDKQYAPVYALNTRMGMKISSDMYLRLKKDKQDATQPICFGDKLFFVEEVKDMRFRAQNDIYYEYYKKVLVGSKVLWLHKTSGYASSEHVRFKKLRA